MESIIRLKSTPFANELPIPLVLGKYREEGRNKKCCQSMGDVADFQIEGR